MKTSSRFKVRMLIVLVLVTAMAFGLVALIRRSREYAKRAEAAQSDMRLYRHSAELAASVALHHRILSESAKTEPDSAAHEKEQAEKSLRERAYFNEQVARASSLRRAYERLANRPWESEPPSVEETKRRMLDAKHLSFP